MEFLFVSFVLQTVFYNFVGPVYGLVSDEITLYNHLFQGSYNPDMRPVVNYTSVVNVYISYTVISLIGLDELNQVLETVGYVDTSWGDEHLTWDPANFSGITRLVVKPTSVWLPDIVLEDSTKSFYDETFIRDFRVEIRNNGQLRWEYGGIFSTNCDLDMSFYPFDMHDCALDFKNWMYASDMVMLYNSTSSINVSGIGMNGLWNIVTTYVKDAMIVSPDSAAITYTKVSFVMRLQRKPGFYLINLIMPCIFVVLISLFVFWMPAESGEKVSLGITLLLSFLVFLLVIMDSTPKNSDNSPLLTTFVISIMAMSATSVLISIMVLYLHHHPTRQRPPRWIRIIFFRGIACLLMMRKQVPIVEKKDEMEGSVLSMIIDDTEDKHGFVRPKTNHALKRSRAIKGSKKEDKDKFQIEELVSLLKKIVTNMEAKENSDAIFEEWAALGRLVDRMFFVISLVYIIIIFIYVFTSI